MRDIEVIDSEIRAPRAQADRQHAAVLAGDEVVGVYGDWPLTGWQTHRSGMALARHTPES
jgi:hypothetical protein